MADANSPELNNPEGNKESIRGLVSSIAQDQLKALGYREVLAELQNWTELNPINIGYIYEGGVQTDKSVEWSVSGQMEGYLSRIKRIPDRNQVKKLTAAALFGIPFSQDEARVVIVSYDFTEPSNKVRLTKLDSNNASNNLWDSVPNIEQTKLLAGKLANTGFLPEGKTSIYAIRRLSWKGGVFKGEKQDDPSIKMVITPGSTFHVEIRKSV